MRGSQARSVLFGGPPLAVQPGDPVLILTAHGDWYHAQAASKPQSGAVEVLAPGAGRVTWPTWAVRPAPEARRG